jgi:hypothetical protein
VAVRVFGKVVVLFMVLAAAAAGGAVVAPSARAQRSARPAGKGEARVSWVATAAA